MKLFGGKKGSVPNQDTENAVISEEEQDIELPVDAALDDAAVLPESLDELDSSLFKGDAEPESETFIPRWEEQNVQEDGFMSSIAETLGLSPEEMQPVTDESETDLEGIFNTGKINQHVNNEQNADNAPKKKWSVAKKLLVAAVVIMALAITGFAGYFVHEMWVTDDSLDIYEADFTGEIIYADENTGSTQVEQTEEDLSVPLDETRKKGCYTFLVAARDVASGCTDVIIVGRFDTENHTINMVSIPRDTMTNRGDLKINTAYAGNLASGGNGIDGLKREVQKILGFEIDSYAIVDVEAVEKLIDAIGGVYFDVPMDMNYSDVSQNLEIHIKKGYQKLSGSDAVKVLRFRKGYANGDLGRIDVQHDFIKALAEQVLDIGNIPNLGAAIEIYQEHVQSNLTPGMILFYAKHFLEMDLGDIQFVNMPQHMGGLVNNQSYIFIAPARWVQVINEYLNPYKADIAQWHLDIKSSMDGGQSFFYTKG